MEGHSVSYFSCDCYKITCRKSQAKSSLFWFIVLKKLLSIFAIFDRNGSNASYSLHAESSMEQRFTCYRWRIQQQKLNAKAGPAFRDHPIFIYFESWKLSPKFPIAFTIALKRGESLWIIFPFSVFSLIYLVGSVFWIIRTYLRIHYPFS